MRGIHEILALYPRDCRPLQVEALGFAGGMSGATLWRISAPRGRLALRRWPTEHPTPERLGFVHAVLRHVGKRGLGFIPVPITTTDGATFVEDRGHLWEFAPWMPGVADYQQAPSAVKLRAALTALAKFHVATADFAPSLSSALSVGLKAESTTQTAALAPSVARQAPSPSIGKRLARLGALSASGVQELSDAIDAEHIPQFAELAGEFLALLPHAIPRAIAELAPLADVPLPLQPCIRDIWHDHILFTGDEVTGIIDFGAVDIETPSGDIARLLGSLVGDDVQDRQVGLAAYSAIRPLSDDEVRAVTALDRSGTLLAGCNWIRWIYVEQRRFEASQQVLARFTNIVARTKRLCIG